MKNVKKDKYQIRDIPAGHDFLKKIFLLNNK